MQWCDVRCVCGNPHSTCHLCSNTHNTCRLQYPCTHAHMHARTHAPTPTHTQTIHKHEYTYTCVCVDTLHKHTHSQTYMTNTFQTSSHVFSQNIHFRIASHSTHYIADLHQGFTTKWAHDAERCCMVCELHHSGVLQGGLQAVQQCVCCAD